MEGCDLCFSLEQKAGTNVPAVPGVEGDHWARSQEARGLLGLRHSLCDLMQLLSSLGLGLLSGKGGLGRVLSQHP